MDNRDSSRTVEIVFTTMVNYLKRFLLIFVFSAIGSFISKFCGLFLRNIDIYLCSLTIVLIYINKAK